MSHAADERLQPLLSCTDMGITALPLGTTPLHFIRECSHLLPVSMESGSSTVMQDAEHSSVLCRAIRHHAAEKHQLETSAGSFVIQTRLQSVN